MVNDGASQRPRSWVTLSQEAVAECRVFRVVGMDAIPAPEDGDTRRGVDSAAWGLDGATRPARFFAIECPDFVNVVAITDADELVLVEQFRHGTQALTLEIPGGLVDPGEDPVAAGLRELREETGFVGSRASVLGRCRPNPAIQRNWLTTILVEGATQAAAPEQDEHEDCRVVVVPRAQVEAMVDRGEIDHALVIAALHFLGRRTVRGDVRP